MTQFDQIVPLVAAAVERAHEAALAAEATESHRDFYKVVRHMQFKLLDILAREGVQGYDDSRLPSGSVREHLEAALESLDPAAGPELTERRRWAQFVFMIQTLAVEAERLKI